MRLAAMCVSAAVMVGCGAEEAAKDVRETVDPVAEAADKMANSGGARVDGDMSVRTGNLTIPMRMDGAVSFEDRLAQFVMDYSEGRMRGVTAEDLEAARREADFPVKTIMGTEETDLSTPSIVRKGKEDGVRWVKFDYSEVDEEGGTDLSGINQMSEVNPDAMLRFLRTVADARETGTRTIDGAATTRYTATVDIRDYPDTVEPERREAAQRTVEMLIEAWGSPTHRVHVWIDEDGLIRREQMTYSFWEAGEKANAKIVLDFLDVGKPQEIEVPDGDEVVDISDELAEQLGKG
jgi:hypothetical protein